MTQTTLLRRRIAARPDIVFDALVTAEGLASWYGPDDAPVIAAMSEPHVGGRFEVTFRTKDGLQHTCAGEFLELTRPERLVMSWRWIAGGVDDERDRVSRLEFRLRATAAGTELTFIHSELATDASALSHEGGWGGALDKLTRRFEGERS
ncbi:MAG TPA: SRPBCC domain-containing protein [Kofleriaceae bacterium]